MCTSLGVTVSTLADAILVGNFVGSDGLAVTNMATPVFLTYSLLGLTLGTGANVLIGRHLGASELENANRIFNVQVLAGAAAGVLAAALALLFRDPLCRFLGAQEALLPLAREYLTVVFASAPIFVLYHILSLSVRTDGDPRRAAAASAAVILINLSLDLLFMKVLRWGMVGASGSLCIAEALGIAVLLPHFFQKHALLHFHWHRPACREIGKFLSNGFGVGSAYIFQALVMLTFNKLLLAHGAMGVTYVAIFGVIYTVSMIPFAAFDGAASAISAVVPIFVGELDAGSVRSVQRQALRAALLAGAAAAGGVGFFAPSLAGLFGLTGQQALSEAASALRVFAASLPFTGLNTVLIALWQAEGRAQLAGAMSVARNLALMLALGAVLIPRYQIAGVSLTYVMCELLCLLPGAAAELSGSSRAHLERLCQDAGRSFERDYPIRTESVAQMSQDLEQVCQEWEIDPRQAFFIGLMVEELLLNIIKFGLKSPGARAYIAVKLVETQEGYILRIRDNVRTYDPFERARGDALDSAVLTMIQKKAKRWSYQRKLMFNYLYLII